MTVHTSTDLHFVYMKPFINREIFNNYREKKQSFSEVLSKYMFDVPKTKNQCT